MPCVGTTTLLSKERERGHRENMQRQIGGTSQRCVRPKEDGRGGEEYSNAEMREKALRDVRGWKGNGLQEIDRHSLR